MLFYAYMLVPAGLWAKKMEIMRIERDKLCVKMSNYALYYALISIKKGLFHVFY